MVGLAAGGGTDIQARLIAQKLSESTGRSFVVENRTGAGGTVAYASVAKSPPDGYTLLVASNLLWIGALIQSAPYDPVKDFAPVILTNRQPNILVVHPSLPARSVRELLALAKARPGELNYASTGTGSPNHLGPELLKSMAKVDIVRINYSSTGTAVTGLLAGQVQLMFANLAAMAPHVKSGKMKALAVTSAEPSILFPGLPTIAASGLPGYEAVSRLGAFAPARTSATIVTRLNQEMVKVLNKTDVKEKFFNSGIETVGSSPAQLTEKVKSEMARLGKVIKDADIRDE